MAIDFNPSAQTRLLGSFKRSFGSEYDRFPPNAYSAPGGGSGYHLANQMFGSVDAEILYSMIRKFKPKRIIEIGSGWTTMLMVQATAVNRDEGVESTIISVDPAGKDGQHATNAWCTAKRLQDTPDVLDDLHEGDFLVIDSSHVFVDGNEIDLALKKMASLFGVYVHFHDIFLPDDYPEAWDHRHYDEQTHIERFLEEHADWSVLLAANYLHVNEKPLLAATFKSYDRDPPIGPGSFWMFRAQAEGLSSPAETSVTADATVEPDPAAPHTFMSDRSGKKCILCGKTTRAKVHK